MCEKIGSMHLPVCLDFRWRPCATGVVMPSTALLYIGKCAWLPFGICLRGDGGDGCTFARYKKDLLSYSQLCQRISIDDDSSREESFQDD
mmetsp:Transcript_55396/g.179696  ORF Transcript_55396/g.179696 Transcript_55396/m.179696 type:complete len:90 (+) Transcript_55396:73-342(+)